MITKISNLLTQGEVVGLSSPMTLEQVKTRFGLPDGVTPDRKGSIIFKYGALQLFFLDQSLVQWVIYLCADFLSTDHKTSSVVEKDWDLDLNIDSLKTFLNENSISFWAVPELSFGDQTCLKTANGLRLIFLKNQLEKIGKVYT